MYEPKAKQVALGLCFHYRYSGAFSLEDEAGSEALTALWKCCVKFDPSKQLFVRKQEEFRKKEWQEQNSEDILLACLLNYSPPAQPNYADPYSTFWIASIRRVRGAVLDFFRAERIITKFVQRGSLKNLSAQQIKKLKNRIVDWEDEGHLHKLAEEYGVAPEDMDELRPTMLYQDRFISMSQLVSERANGVYVQNQSDPGGTVGDWIASGQRADEADEAQHARVVTRELRRRANLTQQEERALDLIYSDLGHTTAEAGALMGLTRNQVEKMVTIACRKMRDAADPKTEHIEMAIPA